MIRSQIQLIADNLHNYHIEQDGTSMITCIGYSKYSNIERLRIESRTYGVRMYYNEVLLALTQHEEEFLSHVMRAATGDFVDYEELAEIIS